MSTATVRARSLRASLPKNRAGINPALREGRYYPTANLTSDKDTGLGNWTDEEIKRAITRGIMRDGTRMPPFPMDWPGFAAMTPDDLNAMVAYLRSIPPISNKVPKVTRPFLPVYLWGKFKMLILQIDPPIIIYPGNVGSAGGRS